MNLTRSVEPAGALAGYLGNTNLDVGDVGTDQEQSLTLGPQPGHVDNETSIKACLG